MNMINKNQNTNYSSFKVLNRNLLIGVNNLSNDAFTKFNLDGSYSSFSSFHFSTNNLSMKKNEKSLFKIN